ncbi:tetratricopeptide repeat protein [candidate division KSB1 bacterium]|nr:tetratricopeptide repeat protein [candidate division KSB1 bacterium]
MNQTRRFHKENQKRTQRRKGAKNPQSFSLRDLCGFASLREIFCFIKSKAASVKWPIHLTATILIALLLTACGNSHFRKGNSALSRGEFQRALTQLSAAVRQDPNNYKHWRELGVALFQVRQFEKAIGALERARQLQPNDSRTLFFLGYSHELEGRFGEAIAIYSEYRRRTLFDPMAKQLQSRISKLSVQLAELEVRRALQEEKSMTLGQPKSNTVAVLYFRNVSERGEWNALLKGLTYMLTTDLGQVKSIRLVERTKLETLMKEIALSSSELYDRFTAPRAGKVLGAERVVVGGAIAMGTSAIQLDAGVIQTSTSMSMVKPVRVVGRLSEVMQLEKQLAFSLIDHLGVPLSETERESIQKLPTESTLAFVAFCRGLEYADSLNIPQAQAAFSEALRLDPSFKAAEQELSTLSTAVLPEQQFVALAASDPTASTNAQHLEAISSATQNSNASASPLIPPVQTGTIVVRGKIK